MSQSGRCDAGLRALLDAPATGLGGDDGPGAVVGVAGGQLNGVAARGLANLEHGVPISPETVFHVASVSKQFTAYAVALLAADGLLSLDDPVAKYLSWVPFDDITVSQLVHHTSGLRDQWALTMLSGRRMEDVITTEDVVTFVAQQRELNFQPGSQFSYSNTGYTLLGEIVAAVSGTRLREFCQERIFGPLGMARSRFVDDHHDILPGRADSYFPRPDGEWGRLALSYSTAGATSLNTTVGDLARWAEHAMTPSARSMLERRTVLSDGHELVYAGGVVVGEYRGNVTLSHSGADAGYRAHVLMLPDKKTASIVLSNSPGVSTRRLAEQAIDLVLSDGSGRSRGREWSPTSSDLDAVVGQYLDDDGDELYRLRMDGAQLVLLLGRSELPLRPSKPGRWTDDGRNVEVSRSPDGIVVRPAWGGARRCRRLVSPATDLIDERYGGTFHSLELDAIVHVDVLDDGRVRLRGAGWGVTELRPLAPGVFLAQVPMLPGLGDLEVIVRFTEDRSQVRMGCARARRIRFDRLAG